MALSNPVTRLKMDESWKCMCRILLNLLKVYTEKKINAFIPFSINTYAFTSSYTLFLCLSSGALKHKTENLFCSSARFRHSLIKKKAVFCIPYHSSVQFSVILQWKRSSYPYFSWAVARHVGRYFSLCISLNYKSNKSRAKSSMIWLKCSNENVDSKLIDCAANPSWNVNKTDSAHLPHILELIPSQR